MPSGKKILYFDCFSGISGDMACGALGHLTGLTEVPEEVSARIGIEGAKASLVPKRSLGIEGARMEVTWDRAKEVERTLADIRDILKGSSLDPEVKERGIFTFELLAEAEGRIHGVSPEKVHFHEVGAVDSILDIAVFHQYILAICPDIIHCSPLPSGGGMVHTSHGRYPVPAPATLEILKGTKAILVDDNFLDEAVTPTGASLMVSSGAAFTPPPPHTVTGTGYGMGSRDRKEMPNALRVITGEALFKPLRDRVYVLETNVDDMNPQHVEILMERVYESGVLDFFVIPVQMKKNRPGWLFTAITEEASLISVVSSIFSTTTTTGIRVRETERVKLDRAHEVVETKRGKVRVKVIEYPQGYLRAVPEYEDVKKISLKEGASPGELIREVEEAWQRKR